MGNKVARKYTDDFKHRAVVLAKDIGIAEAENKLGIPHGNIRNWRDKINRNGKVSRTDTKSPGESPQEELSRLRRKVSELEKANLILKSAAAFFSQDHLK
jgi:transposase-like protein